MLVLNLLIFIYADRSRFLVRLGRLGSERIDALSYTSSQLALGVLTFGWVYKEVIEFPETHNDSQ